MRTASFEQLTSTHAQSFRCAELVLVLAGLEGEKNHGWIFPTGPSEGIQGRIPENEARISTSSVHQA